MSIKTILNIIAATLLFAMIGLTACGAPKTTVAQEQVKVARGNIVQSVNADGELSMPQRRKLSFGINGRIDEVMVEEGARVTRGQVLARLESASLERAVKTSDLAIKSAEADRQQAEGGLKSAQADLRQAELGIKTSAADRDQAEYGVKTAEGNLIQAQLAVKTAEATREQAVDSFRKITYPYTYSTFAFDVPQAVGYLNTAQQQLADAQKGLQAGLTADQYALASRQFQLALENLVNARQRLDRGQGADVFASGQLTVKDYWTLRDAQFQMVKAQLGLDTANSVVNVAQVAVNNARSVALKAQLGTESAQAALDKAQAGVINAQSVLAKAHLGVDKVKYDLDTAKETLDKAIITSPFDGVIAKVNIKAGDVLTPVDYTMTIFELIDPSRMEFTIKVDEVDIPGVKAGQEAAISIDALPGLKLQGKVNFVSPIPVVEGGVVQYEVKIGFTVPEGSPLKAGMSSNATIVINQHNNVLLVPSRAVTQNRSGKTTVKLVAGGQTVDRVVQTGISSATDTEIISGLNEGDTIVVERPARSSSGLLGG